MTHKALIRKLQISCLGLDRIDPLCLLVDDVIEALTQTERTWVGLTDEEIKALASWWPSYDQMPALMVLAKDIQNTLKERNA